jgi:hypothetical protein
VFPVALPWPNLDRAGASTQAQGRGARDGRARSGRGGRARTNGQNAGGADHDRTTDRGPDLSGGGLAPGVRVDLESGQAHYLRDVLRLEPGAALAAFNARDGEWLARIDALGRDRGRLAVESLRRAPEPEPDIWLVFAPVERAPIDVLVQKATELGCALLRPVITRHTTVTRIHRARLIANVREAAEQCGRLSLPEVRAPRPGQP